MWLTICSIPIPITSKAATWCGLAGWATPSMSMPPSVRASTTCICWGQVRQSKRKKNMSWPVGPRQQRCRGSADLGDRGLPPEGAPGALAAAAQIGQDRARRLIRSPGRNDDAAQVRVNCGARALGMLTQVYIHLGVALAGLVSFLSPCVLPLVPPYLGYLSGTTIEQMTDEGGIADHLWRRVVLASLLFVLGFTAVFVALGAGASALGQWVQAHKDGLAIVAGTVIIGFGLHFLGLLPVPLLYRQARFRAHTEGASLVGAFVMGLAFAFGWTPCIGPVLATVLTLAANEGSLGAGVRLLLVYSLGLGVPFVLAAAAIGPFIAFLQRFRRHLRHVEMVMGVLLVLTGVLRLTGSLNWFGQWLIDNVPFLARIEEAVTPERLQTEILKEGAK